MGGLMLSSRASADTPEEWVAARLKLPGVRRYASRVGDRTGSLKLSSRASTDMPEEWVAARVA